MGFGANLVSLRNAKGISRKELAEKLNIPYTTLRNYETEQREPGHKLLIVLAQIFNVTVDSLVGVNVSIKKAPSLSDEAIEVGKAYDCAEPGIQGSIRKLLDLDERKPAMRLVAARGKGLIEIPETGVESTLPEESSEIP